MKVEENRSSLKFFLHKTCLKKNLQKPKLKIKVEQVEGEAPTPQVILQKPNLKIKVEHVEEQVDLQKLYLKNKVEHVEEQIDLQKLDLNIKVEEGLEKCSHIISTTRNLRVLRLSLSSTIYNLKC
jgi:hypothetical protein